MQTSANLLARISPTRDSPGKWSNTAPLLFFSFPTPRILESIFPLTQARRGVDSKQRLALCHTSLPWYAHAACLLSLYTSGSIRGRRHLHTAESCNKLAKGLQRIVAPGAILLPLLVGTCAMYSPLCQSVEEPAQCLHSPHHRNVWRSRLGRAAGLRAGLTSEQR